MGGYQILASAAMCAFQHSTVAGGGSLARLLLHAARSVDRVLSSAAQLAEGGGHGRTSGNDGGYGRIVEAAADGVRVRPAHNATQRR